MMNKSTNEYPPVLNITQAENFKYWRVTVISATEITFDIKVKDYDQTLKDICIVVPHLTNLDADLMQAYDDAFRTRPQDKNIRFVKRFIEKNDFINVECAVFSYLGFRGETITNSPAENENEEEAVSQQQIKQLTPDQQLALEDLISFVRSDEYLFRLQGYAGTGKSFLVCKFTRWLNHQKISYIAACPTNKAAKNLRQIANAEGLDLEVKTVAQLLGQQPELNEETGKEEFVSEGNNSVEDYKLVIIDEFSMINKSNFKEIIQEARVHDTKIVFVGDRAQLPPINEKEPMAATYQMSEATLLRVVRYDGDIARVAEKLRSNRRFQGFETTADGTITVLSQSDWLDRAAILFKSEEYQANPDYVRLLAWRNKTVRSLNNFIRQQLWGENPAPYIVGDRLIALKPLFRPKPGGRGKNKWRILINNSEEATVVGEAELQEQKFNRKTYQYWSVPAQPESGIEQNLRILHEDSRDLHAETVRTYANKKQWSSYFDLSRMFDFS